VKIEFAHLRERSTTGGWINFAVFAARSRSESRNGDAEVLGDLTARVRRAGYRVDQSALAFVEGGQVTYYGSKKLVNYLSSNWLPHWTHTIDV
jgi:hypothetical protein